MAEFPIRIIDRGDPRTETVYSTKVGAKTKLGTVVISDLSALPTGLTVIGVLANAVGLTLETKDPWDRVTITNADAEIVHVYEDTFYMKYEASELIIHV